MLKLGSYFTVVIILFLSQVTRSQNEKSIVLTIPELPNQEFVAGQLRGDQLLSPDTVKSNQEGKVEFRFPSNTPPGLVRVFTSRNQFLDLILNEPRIEVRTHIPGIHDSLEVIVSEENMLFYQFLKRLNEFRQKFDLLAPVHDYYPEDDPFYLQVVNQYERIQKEVIHWCDSVSEARPGLYAAHIIRSRKPVYFEPGLKETDRLQYARDHFLDNIDFTDKSLIRSNTFTSLAIDYLSLYSNPQFSQEQLQDAFIPGVDKLMYEAMDNNEVYAFIVDYLVRGFEAYHFDKVLDYIAVNFSPDQCESDATGSTLEARLKKYREMAPGSKAPGFVLPDLAGNQVTVPAADDNYRLIIFWSSKCPHCKKIMPEIRQLYESSLVYAPLDIITVSLDTETDAWKAFLGKDYSGWTNLCDGLGWNSPVVNDYNVFATPSMYLLDKKMKIVSKPITFEELKSALLNEGLLR
ncbi:MAG: hypothetical protein Kow00127_02430 [Bacteroidales bacterium]